MQIITGITSDPKQQISIPLPDGTSVSLGLIFRPQQKGWFYDIAYSTPTVNFQALGRRLVTSPNILRQFQDVIPFGMALVASGGVEPTTQTGFTDGTLTLLLLDASDIADIESAIYTGSSRLATYGFTVGPTNPPDYSEWRKVIDQGSGVYWYGVSGLMSSQNINGFHFVYSGSSERLHAIPQIDLTGTSGYSRIEFDFDYNSDVAIDMFNALGVIILHSLPSGSGHVNFISSKSDVGIGLDNFVDYTTAADWEFFNFRYRFLV